MPMPGRVRTSAAHFGAMSPSSLTVFRAGQSAPSSIVRATPRTDAFDTYVVADDAEHAHALIAETDLVLINPDALIATRGRVNASTALESAIKNRVIDTARPSVYTVSAGEDVGGYLLVHETTGGGRFLVGATSARWVGQATARFDWGRILDLGAPSAGGFEAVVYAVKYGLVAFVDAGFDYSGARFVFNDRPVLVHPDDSVADIWNGWGR